MSTEELEAQLKDLATKLESATDSIGKLEAKNKDLLGEKKTASKAAQEADAARQAAIDEGLRKSGDVEALEKSWSEKLNLSQTESQATIDGLNESISSLTSGTAATTIAAELAVSGSAEVLLPHIKSRLRTEIREGKPVVVVLDSQGQPSAMTVAELKTEFSNNAAFAGVIVGSKASGAGGIGGKGNGGAVPKGNMGGSKQERTAAIQAKLDA